ncbi:MAG: precorrin-2 C(20)-methyltransferase [Pseudomonadota bacterium]
MSGTLYGVGVGPGDPELITLKAARLIGAAEVVAYPAPDSGESFARSIAADLIPETAVEVPIVIPMRVARFPAQEVYARAAEEIGAHLAAGRDVVVLCEGDPFFYGSFMYLFDRLAGAHAVEVVPGVTSLAACAAVARRPLVARAEMLSVLPATMEDAALRARLGQGQAAAIMKVGRHLGRVRAAVEAAGALDRAVYVRHATLPQQEVMPLSDAPDAAPYFSMVLVPGSDPYAAS